MSFIDDAWGAYKQYTPTGQFIDWLGGSSGGATSNVPDSDRSNFELPLANQRGDWLRERTHQVEGRRAPQVGESSFRGAQEDLVGRLQRQMNGEDSLSQLQLRNATDANIAQQRSLAASASPGNSAMAQRLAAQNIGRMNQGYGNQAAMLGIQERNAAANALGQVAQGARGQDLQRGQFNAGAQLQQTGLNDQYATNLRGMELQNAGMVQRGGMGYAQDLTQRRGQDLGAPQDTPNWERAASVGAGVAPYVLGEGGVVTKPTKAIIGEAGPEAVIPLPYLSELVDRLAMARDRQDLDTQLRAQGKQGLVDKERYGVMNATPFDPVRRKGVVEAGQPTFSRPWRGIVTEGEPEIEGPPRGVVSVVGHERDHIRERPFVARAQAEDLEGLARYWRNIANNGYGMSGINRGAE